MQNKANLLDAQMNVSTILKREYENIANWKLGENKPNTNPIKPNFLRDKTNANLFVEKDYENKPRFRVLTKQTQTKPILRPFDFAQGRLSSGQVSNGATTR